MYGLVKGCFLGPEERDDDWNAHYCGLCLALKHDYGMAARMALNGDAVLLSMLCEAQSPDKWPRMTHRCAFRKFRQTAVIAPGPPGIHYAAAMSLLMAASKIADHIADGDSFVKRFPAFFSRLAAHWQKKSGNRAVDLGFDTAPVEMHIRQQPQRERESGRNFLYYSRPAEEIAGDMCRHTGVLAGTGKNLFALSQIGQMFGRIVWLTDSVRDYDSDRANGHFNALATISTKSRMMDEARILFTHACREIGYCFKSLSLVHPQPVSGIFTEKISTGLFAVGLPILKKKRRRSGRKFSWCDCCDCGDCCDIFECTDCDICGGCDCGDCGGCNCC